MSVSGRHIKEKSMIRRVYANQHGIITLDSDLFGSRKRISTGQKSDKRLLKWYEKNFDEEFEKLYDNKFKTVKDDFSDFTLKQYGDIVLNLTSQNRRNYVQKNILAMFEHICDFQMLDNKKFGELLLTDIKSLHIMKWQKECGYAYQTIANHRIYLKMILQTAMDDDLIRRNPVASVKLPPKATVREKVFYTEAEIKKMIESSKGQLKNYIQLCCFTGMRGSELLALRWDGDIDFENNMIRVDSRIVQGVEDETKSKKVRFIPMFPQAREALIRQRKRTGLREFVFISNQGDRFYGSVSMNQTFQSMLRKNGLLRGTIHDLRRSFNTLLKQYGYPQDWILDIMGHMNDKVNRDHYTGRLDVDMSKIGNIAI